jgi:glyoxylase-like metal-dependent hydrolase (beta-lactamase superfamily II)
MINIGKYHVFSVNEGFMRLDGGAMFGVVPKNLWKKDSSPDDKNRIEIALNVLVLKSDERTIIVDTGNGNKWSDKQREIYQVSSVDGGLKGVLMEAGVTADSVTDVIYTHLHFDHAGGGTENKDDGTVGLTFPNATYHVQKKQWNWANSGCDKDKASYLPENYIPIEKSGKLHIVDGPMELFDGIHLETTDSHTVSHQAVRISDGMSTVYHCGDIMAILPHIKVPWVMAYDLHPLGTIKAKKKILTDAAEKGWYLFLSHEPETPMVKIEKTERGFRGLPA